ncbi:MAG: hypothetical protein WAL30_03875 [Candidatus Aquirickettsiella sp.]
MPYVLNDWFLLQVEKYIAQLKAFLALKKLRLLFSQFLCELKQMFTTIASISLWRLILLVLKRIVSIIKTGFKYFLITVPVPALEFLYVLHFARAFLTLIDFFRDEDNKNLVEISKFLYACFKVFISLLMLIFLILLVIHGMAPLGLAAYGYIKTLFRVYTFSKFGISLLTLGFSYYKIRSYSNDAEHAWLQGHYQANVQKHTHILVLGTLITVLMTLVSVFGFGLGPIGLAVVIVLASLLLIVDIAKAIYFYKNACRVPEPFIGSLAQPNSFIDISTKDYYYRKCRTSRLKVDDLEANRIYLLKEIVIKILQLQTQLNNSTYARCYFFSEKPKIRKKIEGLKQVANILLTDEYEKNKKLLDDVSTALREDYENLNENKTLIPTTIEFFLKKSAILDELPHARDRISKEDITNLQAFRQSFFRNKGDCEDISMAAQTLLQKIKETNELPKEKSSWIENTVPEIHRCSTMG